MDGACQQSSFTVDTADYPQFLEALSTPDGKDRELFTAGSPDRRYKVCVISVVSFAQY